MLAALRVVGRGIVQFERYAALYVLANLLTVAVCLPIFTIPAAFAGLSHLSYTAQTTGTTTIGEFWTGFRAAFRRSLIVGLFNVVILGILAANFWTYREQTDLMTGVLRIIWMIILIGWLMLQMYLWPLLDRMDPSTLAGGFRNAAVMVLINPFFSLTLLVIVWIVVVISSLLAVPWLLLTLSLIACIVNCAVLDRLSVARQTEPTAG